LNKKQLRCLISAFSAPQRGFLARREAEVAELLRNILKLINYLKHLSNTRFSTLDCRCVFCNSMFINIHTHSTASKAQAIISLYEQFEQTKEPGLYSIGLHPLYLQHATMDDVKQWAVYERVVAIGECGLDKLSSFSMEQQQQLFYQQVLLANELKKPLVVHCVRAFDEALAVLKQAQVPVIFHGFNKSKELAQQLVDKGYYISLGTALQQERMQEVLRLIPVTQLFLETDVADVSIEAVYKLAAHSLQVELNSFSLQLQQNAVTVFGEQILLS
jgi:TatD DNase family protein